MWTLEKYACHVKTNNPFHAHRTVLSSAGPVFFVEMSTPTSYTSTGTRRSNMSTRTGMSQRVLEATDA